MRRKSLFKNLVRDQRIGCQMTQVALAAKSGVSIATLNRLELHHVPASTKTAVALGEALDCSVTRLFPYFK